MLRAKGQSLVTETVLINGTSAVALIDTGAEISAASEAFAQQFAKINAIGTDLP